MDVRVCLTLVLAIVAACGDDPVDSFRRGNAKPGDPNAAGAGQLTAEEEKFRAVEADLQKNCGKTCHDTGTYSPTPPAFLAPPDAYKSIKGQPGIVVRDVYTSALLTKGPHAGPAVSGDPEFEKKVVAWLEAEAIAIQSQQLPSTPPVTVVAGPNDVDLSPACASGLTGVHLEFEAAMLGSMLSLSKITLVAPAGQDVHILQPKFVRVLPQPKDGSVNVPDPADSFSNSDQTVPGGKETALAPGSVVFSHASWRPFDMAADKIRIEITKLEPGKVSVISAAATCKDVQGFTDKVLPSMRGQGGFNLNCSQANCHGQAAIGNMNLGANDNNLMCQQVLGKLNQANIGQSLIVTKPTSQNHGGGQLQNANGWRQLFVDNAGVFF
jgi:hypothetical protein